jgi:hypothetical protein
VWPDDMGPRGAHDISLIVGRDEKERMSVMATVRARGKKKPRYMSILAHGKTARVEVSQTGRVMPHERDHSASGWMTQEAFVQFH